MLVKKKKNVKQLTSTSVRVNIYSHIFNDRLWDCHIRPCAKRPQFSLVVKSASEREVYCAINEQKESS